MMNLAARYSAAFRKKYEGTLPPEVIDFVCESFHDLWTCGNSSGMGRAIQMLASHVNCDGMPALLKVAREALAGPGAAIQRGEGKAVS